MTNANEVKHTSPAPNGKRLLTRRLIRRVVPVSDMTIWRWERDGRFPRHLTINGRNYWIHEEVEGWLEGQARSSVPRKEGSV